MKLIKYLSLSLLLLNCSFVFAQTDSSQTSKKHFPFRTLTTEPAIGINPYPMSDMLVSNLVQWNVKKRLSIISYTSYTYNNAFLRDFNFIKTNYNYSLNQKLGVGVSFYGKRSSHAFSLLGGINYDTFKETLNNPEFEKVVASMSSLSPDFGLMYNLKLGRKKYFFSYRMYIPLYPYPVKTTDISASDGNMANISLEFGIGVRLK